MKEDRIKAFMEEIMDYLYQLGAWTDVTIYANGYAYAPPTGSDPSIHETQKGTPYACTGDCDVETQLEYCNPKSLSMAFEGPLYEMLNYGDGTVGEALNKIGAAYSLYFEQGHAWNLSFYEI